MMMDEHIKEAISLRYIELIAAYNGFKTNLSYHDYGTDLNIVEVGYRNENGKKRLSDTGREIKIQLKATTVNSILEEQKIIKYDLDSKNFNDIIKRRNSAYPLILILFILPTNRKDWLSITEEELRVKKCAYWYFPEENKVRTSNSSKKRIEINKNNLIKPDSLNEIINKL